MHESPRVSKRRKINPDEEAVSEELHSLLDTHLPAHHKARKPAKGLTTPGTEVDSSTSSPGDLSIRKRHAKSLPGQAGFPSSDDALGRSFEDLSPRHVGLPNDGDTKSRDTQKHRQNRSRIMTTDSRWMRPSHDSADLNEEEENGSDVVQQRRSSGRQRRKPLKLLSELDNDASPAPAPKPQRLKKAAHGSSRPLADMHTSASFSSHKPQANGNNSTKSKSAYEVWNNPESGEPHRQQQAMLRSEPQDTKDNFVSKMTNRVVDKSEDEEVESDDDGSAKRFRSSGTANHRAVRRQQNRADNFENAVFRGQNHAQTKLQSLDSHESDKDSAEGISIIAKSRVDLAYHEDVDKPISNDNAQFETVKQIVIEKLTGNRPMPLIGLDDDYTKVHHLLEQTVTAGEGNSLILIGARGTGKTALVNTALKQMTMLYKDQFHVVRLSGFLQTDDKLALREIWRQLGREMEVEEEGHELNYADTLTTILATFSHDSTSPASEPDQISKSVIFVIDEFDLFTTHPRQTLLYNLFDIAQSRKAPIAVLGLTTRVDVVESLEKRVKSRFSHRHIHIGMANSGVAFLKICKAVLQIQPEILSFRERNQLSRSLDAAQSKPTTSGNQSVHQDSITGWNSSIESLFKSTTFNNQLSRIYHTSKSIPTAMSSFILPVALLKSSKPYLDPSSFTPENALIPPDSKLHLLPSLPTLALALLICAARLDVILDTDVCNFNMVYEEYINLAAKARITASNSMTGMGIARKLWGKEVARDMWEKLIELELLVPVTGGMAASDMVKCDVALEEIGGAVPDLEKGLEKWCREI